MIYDISPLIDENIAVWPGDSRPEARDILRIREGASVNLSTISFSCHTGAHADAPNHFADDAPGIDEVDLERYIGDCVLVDVQPRGNVVRPEDLEGVDLNGTPRILLRTGCFKDRTAFPDPLVSLAPELVQFLAVRKMVLVGLDSPSVDTFDSKELPAHHALHQHGIAILENLQLDGAPAGRYELIALPLRLKSRDASPVRAILRTV
ncbi:MAG: cyclase family protein [Planctomycetota bacterium]|jgi:arylformamidase